MHEGHRGRMFERLVQSDAALQDHEVLEILLFYAIPRRNTNDIAHRLISVFGSLAAVFEADHDQLVSVEGVGDRTAKFLIAIGKVCKRVDFRKNASLPSAYTFESFSKYLSEHFCGATQEFFELYSVKKSGEVEFCQSFTSDERNKVVLPASDINRAILTFKSHGLIIVHNHLVNSCKPSLQDDETTKTVQLICNINNVKLLDHFIVSPMEIYSYYTSGRLEDIRSRYTLGAVIGGRR